MNYQFTEQFQLLTVACILKDPTLLAEIRDAIKPEYFNSYSEQEIIRVATELFDKVHEKPSRDVLAQSLIDRANRLGWDPKDRDNLLSRLYSIYDLPLAEADVKHIRDKVASFGRIQACKLAMLESISMIEDFEKGSDKVNLADIETKVQRALSVGAEKRRGVNLSHALFNMKAVCSNHDLSSIDRRVATGYPSIDRMLKGGLGGGEIAFVIAPSNKGKSMILVNLAVAAFRANKKTVYFSFEMKEPEIVGRMAAIMSHCTIDQCQKEDPAYVAKINELRFLVEQRQLQVIYIPPSQATPGNLRAILMWLQSVDGFTPDALFVDYLDEMPVPGNRRGEDDGLYQGYGKLASDLLSIGVDYKCPVWTASQVNREGYGDAGPTLATIGRSMQKVDKAEFVITLLQDELQYKKNELVIKVLKNRRGPGVGTKIKCVSDMTKALIYELPSSGPAPVAALPQR
ncbi:MAG: hypothetical protein E6R03_09105 [Hyphomicrobiaceae bacterium]|nr:MAG: hypothetical protein E6R03_09105 [Hyphomicrobiaceae bacterium]